MARHFSDGTPMDAIEERDAWEDDVLSDYYDNVDQNYSQDAYENALQYAREELDLYLLNIIKGEEGKKYILDSDFDATVAGVIDDVFGEEEYKELQNDKNTYYKLFDALVEHGIDQADKYGAPVIEDDDLKDSSVKDNYKIIKDSDASDKDISSMAASAAEQVAHNVTGNGDYSVEYIFDEINRAIQDQLENKWPFAGVHSVDETEEYAYEKDKEMEKIYNRVLSGVLGNLTANKDKWNINGNTFANINEAVQKLLHIDASKGNDSYKLADDDLKDQKDSTPQQAQKIDGDTLAQLIQDGVNAAKNKVFQDSNGKNYLAAEDVDEIIGDDYDEEYLDAVLRRLNAKLTDRTHPDYPYGGLNFGGGVESWGPLRKQTPEEEERDLNYVIGEYLKERHPDMSVQQWKKSLTPQEEINFNKWHDEESDFGPIGNDIPSRIKVDDNGHKDYYSDRTLKNIINTLDGRLL